MQVGDTKNVQQQPGDGSEAAAAAEAAVVASVPPPPPLQPGLARPNCEYLQGGDFLEHFLASVSA